MKIKKESLIIKICSIICGLLLFITLGSKVLNYEYVSVGVGSIRSLSFFEASDLGGLVLSSQVMVFVSLFLIIALFVICFLEYFVKDEYKKAVKIVYTVVAGLLIFFVLLAFVFMVIWVCSDNKGAIILNYTSSFAKWTITFGVWFHFLIGLFAGILFLADSLDMELGKLKVGKFSLKRRTRVKVLGEDDYYDEDEE